MFSIRPRNILQSEFLCIYWVNHSLTQPTFLRISNYLPIAASMFNSVTNSLVAIDCVDETLDPTRPR
jgi:hypothetical protein